MPNTMDIKTAIPPAMADRVTIARVAGEEERAVMDAWRSECGRPVKNTEAEFTYQVKSHI